MRKYLLLILCIPLFSWHSYAQHNNVIDSLSVVANKLPDDTNKVNTLNALSEKLWRIDKYDTALVCANNANYLADKLNFKKGEAIALRNIGVIYDEQGNYSQALNYDLKALSANQQMGNKNGMTANLCNIGSVYDDLGNYPKALDNYLNALTFARQNKNMVYLANILCNIGIVYLELGNYSQAMEYDFKALAIYNQIGNNNGKALTLGNIGSVYYAQANYSKALEYYQKALVIYQQIEDKHGIAISLGNIGAIYCDELGSYPQALDYQLKSLAIYHQIGNKHGITFDFTNIGVTYSKLKKYEIAKTYLDSALVLSKNIGDKAATRNTYKSLSVLDSTKGDFKSAYENYKLYKVYTDSIVNKENTKKTVQAEMNFKFEQEQLASKAAQDIKDAKAQQDKKRQLLIRNAFIAGFTLMLLLAFFIFRSYRQKQKANVIITQQKEAVEQQNKIIEHQKTIVEEKNKDITDSIHYASRIQRALLTADTYISRSLNEHFIFFKPRDIVSGDFYWNFSANGLTHVACCDCTGHGVPGAFMSLLNISLLNETVIEKKIIRPDLVLNEVRENIIKALNSDDTATESKDGMDAVFCTFDFKNKKLQAACANNPIWIISEKGELTEIKPDKMPVGVHSKEQELFTLQEVNLSKGDCVYLFTDGYADQFGGANGKKFKYKQLKELLIANASKPMSEQKIIFEKTFETWKDKLDQVDDVLVMGIRV